MAATSSLAYDCLWSEFPDQKLYVAGAGFIPCWFLKYLLCTCCCHV